jgi:hypothetical protein
MESTSGVATVKQNFILQQGLPEPPAASCPLQYSALLFQPRLVGLWLVVATLLQAPRLFCALAAVLWWSALAPRFNPFDAFYNWTLGRLRGTTLTAAPAPRRFAQFLAGSFALAVGVSLALGWRMVAFVLEGFFLVAVAALVFGGFCIGSFFFISSAGAPIRKTYASVGYRRLIPAAYGSRHDAPPREDRASNHSSCRCSPALPLALLFPASRIPPHGPDSSMASENLFKYARRTRTRFKSGKLPKTSTTGSARFEYSMSRALSLSETRRNQSAPLPIHRPQDLYIVPSGVCVDLSRFAVETLRAIDPSTKPDYLMIEFAPVTMAGNTYRFHWLASFKRDGKYCFFADSKRPGQIAGPYESASEFIDEYAKYRGREVIAFRELDSFQRKQRTMVVKQSRESP